MSVNPTMLIDRKVVGPLATNCFILACPETRKAIIVDPGGDPDLIIAAVEQARLEPVEIVCTHGHSDHIASVAELKRTFGVGFALHAADAGIVKLSVGESALWGMGVIEEPAIDRTLAPGDILRIGTIEGTILHTPGHTPGGISLLFDGSVLVGDTLFAGSIGRTDLHGGDFDTLISSIRTELLPLSDDTAVYTGHGPSTTIGRERTGNPFL